MSVTAESVDDEAEFLSRWIYIDIADGYTPAMAKVMISMPDELLRSLDAAAGQSASRSEFIGQLVRTELEAEERVTRREHGIDDIRALTARYQLSTPPEEVVRSERER